jgi:hypothetical protein
MVAIDVTAEQVARGNIQQIPGGAGCIRPSRHKAAARRRRRRHSFNSPDRFACVWKLNRRLRVGSRLVHSATSLKWRGARDSILPRQIEIAAERSESQRYATKNK